MKKRMQDGPCEVKDFLTGSIAERAGADGDIPEKLSQRIKLESTLGVIRERNVIGR